MIEIQTWFFLAIICFILELITTSFFLLWFGVGASIAILLNYLGYNDNIQFISFILISLILLFLSKKFTKKITHNSLKKTNSKRLIGKKGIVTSDIIPPLTGIVKVNGEEWTAISKEKLLSNELVTIEKIDSVKLIVSKIKK